MQRLFLATAFSATVLIASTLGAVFYLNGTEVGRAWMPTGAVDSSTFALSARYPKTEPIKSVVANVVEGDNIYAAEIHTASPAYANMTFSSSLTAVFPEPIEIISPPCLDQTVEENQVLKLSVQLTGTDPVFRWFYNSNRIASANARVYEIPSVQSAHAGDYWVVITNTISAVSSCVTRVTVTPDVTAPGLVSAIAQEATSPPYYILVRFTERIRPDGATIRGNYSISSLDSPGESLVISNAQVNANLVRLTTSPWRTNGNYILTVRNVADLRSNFISWLSNRIAVIIPPGRVVFPFDGMSKAWNVCEAQARGVSLPSDWKEPDFDDRDPLLWPTGRGIIHCYSSYLACGMPGDQMCAVLTCPTLISNRYRFYFRSHFTNDTNTCPKFVALRYTLGEPSKFGAVFYLNGVQIHRQDPYIIWTSRNAPIWTNEFLPTGPVCEASRWELGHNLRQGDNVLAVELFGYESGPIYGVQLSEVPAVTLPPLPVVSVTTSGCPCVFSVSWSAADFPVAVLQATTNLTTGPWVTVATNSPYAAEVTPEGSRFFRLLGPDGSW